jgi:hypothetical protein
MAVVLHIDSSAVVAYTNYLEKLSKSAMPNTVRNTLSKAAFDVKGKTMLVTANKNFTQRKPTFFKSASTVDPAKGYNISAMQSQVGFKAVPKDKGRAVDDLEEQEHSGRIGGRTFIPLKQARAGNSWHRNVKLKMRIEALDNLIFSDKAQGDSPEEKFVKSAIHAGKGKLVVGNRVNVRGNRTVFLINSVKRIGADTKINSTPVYSMKKGRKVTVKARPFMKEASIMTQAKLDKIFIDEAVTQINRLTT